MFFKVNDGGATITQSSTTAIALQVNGAASYTSTTLLLDVPAIGAAFYFIKVREQNYRYLLRIRFFLVLNPMCPFTDQRSCLFNLIF